MTIAVAMSDSSTEIRPCFGSFGGDSVHRKVSEKSDGFFQSVCVTEEIVGSNPVQVTTAW
jgi:hypothetical protein